jgi:hypothetical protein
LSKEAYYFSQANFNYKEYLVLDSKKVGHTTVTGTVTFDQFGIGTFHFTNDEGNVQYPLKKVSHNPNYNPK